MKSYINFIRYSLLVFLSLSSIVALVVLGLDLDLLLNGPEYLSKVISNIVNRFVIGVQESLYLKLRLYLAGYMRRR